MGHKFDIIFYTCGFIRILKILFCKGEHFPEIDVFEFVHEGDRLISSQKSQVLLDFDTEGHRDGRHDLFIAEEGKIEIVVPKSGVHIILVRFDLKIWGMENQLGVGPIWFLMDRRGTYCDRKFG